MKNSPGLLIHQEDAAASAILRLILLAMPSLMIVAGAALWGSGERTGAFVLWFEAAFVALLFSIIIPRRYRVYEDKVTIVFGGPFSYSIKFENVSSVEVTRRNGLTMNMASTIALTYVRINKKNGLAVAITPQSNERFSQAANGAISEWHRRQKR